MGFSPWGFSMPALKRKIKIRILSRCLKVLLLPAESRGLPPEMARINPCPSLNRAALRPLLFLLLAAACFAQQPYAALKQTGPRNLLIALNCKNGDRPAFRRAISTTSASRLAELEKQGTLRSYRLLFNRFVDTDAWDALIMLEFSSDAGLEKWQEIETATPAGLDADAAKLITAGTTYLADLVSHQESPAQSSADKPVYLIVPYTIDPNSPDDYVKYAQGYVVPQLQGWMKEGVLSQWDLLVSRYAAARPWQAVLVLKYRDQTAFGERDRVMAKVREDLAQNAEWKAISEGKHKMRTELRAVIAEELAASKDGSRQ